MHIEYNTNRIQQSAYTKVTKRYNLTYKCTIESYDSFASQIIFLPFIIIIVIIAIFSIFFSYFATHFILLVPGKMTISYKVELQIL